MKLKAMLTEEQYQQLSKHLPPNLNPDLKALYLQNADFLTLQKGKTIVDEFKQNNKSYIIINGSCVRFIITPEGEEKAITFHTESFMHIIGNTYIKSDHSKVSYEIKLNEPTDFVSIDLSQILQKALTDLDYVLFATQNALKFTAIQNQIQNHLTGLTKDEFLLWLIDNYGFLFQRFSSKDIASFMSVSPTWLSLLKKKLYEKK